MASNKEMSLAKSAQINFFLYKKCPCFWPKVDFWPHFGITNMAGPLSSRTALIGKKHLFCVKLLTFTEKNMNTKGFLLYEAPGILTNVNFTYQLTQKYPNVKFSNCELWNQVQNGNQQGSSSNWTNTRDLEIVTAPECYRSYEKFDTLFDNLLF